MIETNKYSKDKVYQLNAIKLAYVGDAYFSLAVRVYLVGETNKTNREINRIANKIVCAKNQARLLDEVIENLNQEEIDIITRARNAHINNKAKNSTLEEYSKATQFEALIGYWSLTNSEKIQEVCAKNIYESYLKVTTEKKD